MQCPYERNVQSLIQHATDARFLQRAIMTGRQTTSCSYILVLLLTALSTLMHHVVQKFA